MIKDSTDNLDHKFKELLANAHLVTEDAVNDLKDTIETLQSKLLKKKKESPIFFRFVTAMKMWNVYLKIKKFEIQLKTLKTEALKNTKLAAIEKTIRELQKKGFLLQMPKETCIEAFMATLAEMQSVGCTSSFCFHVASRDEGILELLVFSDEGNLSTIKVVVDEQFSPEALLQAHCHHSIPLSQLQDVAGWLHNHGAIHAPILSREAIEQKLEGLMRSCPHGAYVLHAQNKALTLSRLSPKGHIEHLIINLQKELGCYTIERSGSDISATRAQFRRRLEQMGTPIRLVVNNKQAKQSNEITIDSKSSFIF